MNVIFHEYLKTNRERKLLGCPHIWLEEIYQAPGYFFREMEKRGMRICFRVKGRPPQKGLSVTAPCRFPNKSRQGADLGCADESHGEYSSRIKDGEGKAIRLTGSVPRLPSSQALFSRMTSSLF